MRSSVGLCWGTLRMLRDQALGCASQQGHWSAGAERSVFSTGPTTRLPFGRYLGGVPGTRREEVGKGPRDVAKSIQVCK